MKERFNQLVAETIKPLLKNEGFVKKGLNFFKQKDDLIFVFNFQNSQGNTGTQIRFYINCGIHSTYIDQAISKAQNAAPKEYECYFRERISDITGAKTDGYIVNEQLNMQALEDIVVADMKKAIVFFNQIQSTKDLVDLMIQKNGLNNYLELFEYLLVNKDLNRLKQYAGQLYEAFGKEKRWTIFENNLNNLLIKYHYKKSLDQILDSIHSAGEEKK
jgi:hypothetical protein